MKKRIRVWADIHSTGLFDDVGKYYSQDETSISDSTWSELQKWVEDYDDVAIMSDEERVNNNGLIKELDIKGLRLMQKISAEWKIEKSTGSELTFVYYSEGLMKIISNV